MVKGKHFTEKHESLKHYLIKMLIYYKLRSLEHKVEVEYRLSDDSQIDIIDFDTGIIYEPQGNMDKKIIQAKADKYLKLVSARDLVPIPLAIFKGWNIKDWEKKLNKFIIE